MPSPLEFWIVPPDPAAPVPVTLMPPRVPVLFRMMPLDAPFDEMLWKRRPDEPIEVLTTLSAVPVVEVIVLPVPAVVTVPPPVALKPVPLVVVIASPPFGKLIVPPVLFSRLTAVFAPVVSVVLPLKLIVPELTFWTTMPLLTPPVALMAPEKVTLLVSWLSTNTTLLPVVLVIDETMLTAPVPFRM